MASVFPAYQTPGESAAHTSAATRWPQLPFQSVFALDFEFVSESGANPVPVCLVARELRTDRLIRLWQDELTGRPPFPINDDTLFVAYFAPAELGCFLELGFPVPTRVLDLYTEFRNATKRSSPTERARPVERPVPSRNICNHCGAENRGARRGDARRAVVGGGTPPHSRLLPD